MKTTISALAGEGLVPEPENEMEENQEGEAVRGRLLLISRVASYRDKTITRASDYIYLIETSWPVSTSPAKLYCLLSNNFDAKYIIFINQISIK